MSFGNTYSKHWSTSGIEPKRSHRFIFSAVGTHGSIPEYTIKKVTKPSFTIAETAHKFLNWTFWYPGKIDWDPITVTLVDPAGPNDAGKSLMSKLKASGWMEPGTGDSDVMDTTVSKIRAMNAFGAGGTVKITQYGPANQMAATDEFGRASDVKIEEWSLFGAWIQKAAFGELNYDNDSMVEITLTIRYDWAEYKFGSNASIAVSSNT